MDLYDAIKQRYSVRAYQDRPVEDEKLGRILDAGRLAPSGRNGQAWKFIVVREASLRRGLAEFAAQPFIAQAPVVLAVVSMEPDRLMHCGIPAGPVDCAIAIDHMALAAVAEGLGSCWIGHFDQSASRELLGVPASAKIIGMLLIGYPADRLRPKTRKPLEQVVCYDRFRD